MNGALGIVYGIIYAEGEVPPAVPEVVLVQFSTTPNANTRMDINPRGSTHFHSVTWGVTSGASLNETHACPRFDELD